MIVPPLSIYPHGPNQSNSLSYSCIQFSFTCIGLHPGLTLPVGIHSTLPELHQLFSFPNQFPIPSKQKERKTSKEEENHEKTVTIRNHNKVAWPCTQHNKGCNSSTNKSQTRNIHHDSISMDFQCIQGNINPSL